MANGLLTQAEKPFFSLSMPLDQSMSRAESSPYQPQLPQSYEPYDLKSLVSNTFQAERGQIEQLTDMSERFRQRAALTGNALERKRLNAQATIWENRATGLVEKIGESTTDDTVEELQGIFANLKKQGKLPQTESQYAQFMFNHGYNDKEDHDTYKFVWSSFGSPSTYKPGTLFNKQGESQVYESRAQEIKARQEGYYLSSPPTLGNQKTITQDGVVYYLDPITGGYVPAIGPKSIDYEKDYIPVTEDEKVLVGNDGQLIYPQGIKLSPGGLQKRVDYWRKNTGADNSDKKPLTEIEYYKDQAERVFIGLAQNNTVGDIAAINALQRMIDPGVSVREGDVTLLEMATPWVSYLALLKEKATGGGRFLQEEREKMANLARLMAEYVRESRVTELDNMALLMRADSPQLTVKRVFGEGRLEELRNPLKFTDISGATESPQEEAVDESIGSTPEYQFEATEEELQFFTPGTVIKLPDGRIVRIK